MLIWPIPTYIKFYFYPIHQTGFIMLLFTFPFYYILKFFFNIEIHNFPIVLLFLFLISIMLLFIFIMIDSFEFYFRNLSVHIRNPIEQVQYIFGNYPGQFFQNFKFKDIFLLLPIYYLSMFLIPIAIGDIIVDFWKYFFIIFIFIFIFLIITIINWHYGLKKYEAFG